jgi:uncharacterized membrane protein
MTARKKATVAVVATAGAVAVTIAVARQRSTRSLPVRRDGGWTTLRAITIDRPAAEVYGFWRDLTRLAAVMDPPARVELLAESRSQWTVEVPGGRTLQWTAEIIKDEPESVLTWRVDAGPVPHEGRVEFTPAPNDRGTEVRVGLRYRMPAGRLGAAAAKLVGTEPDQVLRTTLRRMKSLLECGAVVRVTGQPTGRGPVQERVTRLAQRKLVAGGRP